MIRSEAEDRLLFLPQLGEKRLGTFDNTHPNQRHFMPLPHLSTQDMGLKKDKQRRRKKIHSIFQETLRLYAVRLRWGGGEEKKKALGAAQAKWTRPSSCTGCLHKFCVLSRCFSKTGSYHHTGNK